MQVETRGGGSTANAQNARGGGGDDSKENDDDLANLQNVTATARIKNIVEDENKSSVDAVQLEVNGSIAIADAATKQASKRAIIFVIDKSGSMSGSRINSVREAMIPFVLQFCENPNVLLKVVMFESRAHSHDIPSNPEQARATCERIIQASGGTNFESAAGKLVELGREILFAYPEHEMTVIICSDGEVSKGNAQRAHEKWKNFVRAEYTKKHEQFPFVESIGISSNHDADILDGFILDDDHGNYTKAADSVAIKECFDKAAENATVREAYPIRLQSESRCLCFIDKLYNGTQSQTMDFTLNDTEFLITAWVDKKQLNTRKADEPLRLSINGQRSIEVTIENIDDRGQAQQSIIDFYHQRLKDMINGLRQIRDEGALKSEAAAIQRELEASAARFEQITATPPDLEKLQNELNVLLLEVCDTADMDKIEERAMRLRHFKKVRRSWKGHKATVSKFTATLKALKDLLAEITTGQTRMQEIRQHILDLHFSKKHANRMTKLILNDEQLAKRQALYDKAQATELGEDELKALSDEVGSGCFLSTMTRRDCAEDCQALWLCGRVNRAGGIQVSNPEIVRVEYISPDLVSNEYFEMAMDVAGADGGFFDGSRNRVNARLFPIYGGSAAFLRVSRPYLFEAFAHTLSGRADIKINEYSALSAVCGFMIAARPQTTQNLTRLFADIAPSFRLLGDAIKVFPYANARNKEVNFKSAAKVTLRDFFRTRLERYVASAQCRCSSLVSNVQCLFGDALLAGRDALPLLLTPKQSEVVWLSMVAQRLRSLVKGRIPGDQARFTEARLAEMNHSLALRVLIRGTDADDDRFDDADDEKAIAAAFAAECTAQRELKKEYLAPFDIPSECKALSSDDIDFSAFAPRRCTPSMVAMCAQILSRVRVADLIRAHRFFRVLDELKADDEPLQHIEKFKAEAAADEHSNSFSALCEELSLPLNATTLRALCGFALTVHTNSLFQRAENYEALADLVRNPSAIVAQLHEKVIAESKRKPRRMVARVKHKGAAPNPTVRSRHNNLRRQLIADFAPANAYWKDCDPNAVPTLNLTLLGEHGAGKTTLLGRLLVECKAMSPAFMARRQKGRDVHFEHNEFSKLIARPPYAGTCAALRTAVGVAEIVDSPNPKYFKNVLKQFANCDAVIFCVRAGAYAESLRRADTKKGVRGGQCSVISHAMTALLESKVHIVCVTQMDAPNVKFAQKAFEECKTAVSATLSKRGFKPEKLIFVPVCALSAAGEGGNVCAPSKAMPWFKGFEVTHKKQTFSGATLKEAIDAVSQMNALRRDKRAQLSPKMLVTGKYSVRGVGAVVQCAVSEGAVRVGDEIKFVPSNATGKIVSMERSFRAAKEAMPGDSLSIQVKFSTGAAKDVLVGDMGVSVKEAQVTKREEVRALVFVPQTGCVKRIRVGFRSHLFLGSDHRPCLVKAIAWKKKGDGAEQKKPLFIEAGDSAEVVLTLTKSMAVAKYDECKVAGRFVTVTCNAPVMYGKIL